MFRNTAIVALLVSLFVVTGRCESESLLPLVTGGTVTVVGEAPSVVSIRRPLAVGGEDNFYCSGTIVNVNHVVTAASCVHDPTFNLINPFWFRIIAGDLSIHNPSFQRFTTRASHIFTHPGYRAEPARNNVAVMRTLNPFTFPSNNIDFAVRTTIPLPVGQNCRFIGWGSETETGVIIATQRWVAAPIIDRTCGGIPITDNMLCAGTLTGAIPIPGVCRGNMGGGLFCNVNGWWEFSGILSSGFSCGAANVAGQYMQVRDFNTWINQQFTRGDHTNPGIPVQAPAP